MSDVEDELKALEIKFATVQAQLLSLHEDNRKLFEEMSKLSDKLSAMNLQFSQGKGLVIGGTMVLGSIFTIINQFFFK